jgi:hypothetical protein
MMRETGALGFFDGVTLVRPPNGSVLIHGQPPLTDLFRAERLAPFDRPALSDRPKEWAGALDVLAGRRAETWWQRHGTLLERGDDVLALWLTGSGLVNYASHALMRSTRVGGRGADPPSSRPWTPVATRYVEALCPAALPLPPIEATRYHQSARPPSRGVSRERGANRGRCLSEDVCYAAWQTYCSTELSGWRHCPAR